MPIYSAKVRVGEHEQMRLVDAPNETRALRHLTKQHITIEPIRTGEQIKAMAELAAKGIKVEVATDE